MCANAVCRHLEFCGQKAARHKMQAHCKVGVGALLWMFNRCFYKRVLNSNPGVGRLVIDAKLHCGDMGFPRLG